MARKRINHQAVVKSRGQSLLEFALVLPLLLVLVLGAMDFGRMFYTKIVLTNAAREGANYLSYHTSDATVYEGHSNPYQNTFKAIKEEADSSGIDPDLLTIPTPSNCCTAGEKVGVTVELLDIDLIFSGFYQLFFPSSNTIDLSSTVWMVVQ